MPASPRAAPEAVTTPDTLSTGGRAARRQPVACIAGAGGGSTRDDLDVVRHSAASGERVRLRRVGRCWLLTWLLLSLGCLLPPMVCAAAGPAVSYGQPYSVSVPIEHLACPLVSVCFANGVDGGPPEGNGAEFSLGDPASGNWAPSRATPFETIGPMSCPSVKLCAAVGEGYVTTSPNPTAAHPLWHVEKIFNDHSLTAVSSLSCPSTSFCAVSLFYQSASTGRATGSFSAVYVSNDPRAAHPHWTRLSLRGVLYPAAVSCSTNRDCILVGTDARVAVTEDAGSASVASWHVITVHGIPRDAGFGAVSCTPELFCAMTAAGDSIVSAVDPFTERARWKVAHLTADHENDPGQLDLEGLSCGGTRSVCIADGYVSGSYSEGCGGFVLLSSPDAQDSNAWTEDPDAAICPETIGLSCPSDTECVAALNSVINLIDPQAAGTADTRRAEGHGGKALPAGLQRAQPDGIMIR